MTEVLSDQAEGSTALAMQAVTEPGYAKVLFPLGFARSGLGMAVWLTLAFATSAVVISLIIGAPLNLPTERVSTVLGFNAMMPVLMGLLVYLLAQGLNHVAGRQRWNNRQMAAFILHDVTFIALFVIVSYFHFNLKMWIPLINPELYDAAYYATDEAVRPLIDVFVAIRQAIAPYLPWADEWYQIAFHIMFLISFCNYAINRDPNYSNFALALLLVMVLGAFSYLIAPAVGPFLYETGVNERAANAQAGMWWGFQQVQQHGAAWVDANGSEYFTGALGAMPSLHIAYATVMVYYMIRSRSAFIPLFVALAFWMLIESVASRWHYVIDAPAGFLLAVFVIWLSNRICDPMAKAAEAYRAQAVQT